MVLSLLGSGGGDFDGLSGSQTRVSQDSSTLSNPIDSLPHTMDSSLSMLLYMTEYAPLWLSDWGVACLASNLLTTLMTASIIVIRRPKKTKDK